MLGAHDASERFLVPEKLYGREAETRALLDAFERVVGQGRPELVFVSGYSGIGKSSVVSELHKALVSSHGLFATGKFEQYKRDIPHATIVQAFSDLVRQILDKSEVEVQQGQRALRDALGPNAQLIVDFLPELEVLLGPQPPVTELPAQEARGRITPRPAALRSCCSTSTCRISTGSTSSVRYARTRIQRGRTSTSSRSPPAPARKIASDASRQGWMISS